MPWTRRQVRFLLSKVSPLTGGEKTKMKGELHEEPSLGHKRKGHFHKSMQEGGTAPKTADYKLHEGERVLPPPIIRTAAVNLEQLPTDYRAPRQPAGPTPGYHAVKAPTGLGGAAVPRSYRRGGTIPRTGIYRLHRGERVIPSRMAQHFQRRRR